MFELFVIDVHQYIMNSCHCGKNKNIVLECYNSNSFVLFSVKC